MVKMLRMALLELLGLCMWSSQEIGCMNTGVLAHFFAYIRAAVKSPLIPGSPGTIEYST